MSATGALTHAISLAATALANPQEADRLSSVLALDDLLRKRIDAKVVAWQAAPEDAGSAAPSAFLGSNGDGLPPTVQAGPVENVAH